MKTDVAIGKAMQSLMMMVLWCTILCVPIVMVMYLLNYQQHFTVPNMLLMVAFLALFYIAYKYMPWQRITNKLMITSAFVIANAAMITSLLTFDTQPCSDYKVLFNMACQMANGEYDLSAMDSCMYAITYNYQTGIALFESLFLRAFGCRLLGLQIFAVILANVTLGLAYLLAKALTDKRSAAYTLLLLATFYPMLVTVNQFSNQHIAAPMILAVLMCLRSQRVWLWLLGGVLAAILNYLRPEGILLVATALLTAMLRLRKGSIRLNSRPLIGLVLFVGCYMAVQRTFDAMTINLGYAYTPVSKANLPYFKFHKGLLGYDRPEVSKFDCDLDSFNRWEKAEVIKSITQTPATTATYVATKMIRYLGEYDWKFENTYNHSPEIYQQPLIRAFVMLGWAQYIIAVALAIVGYRRWKRQHAIGPVQIFYLGVVCVYFFIEAFSSYRYESYPILFIFSGYALNCLISRDRCL